MASAPSANGCCNFIASSSRHPLLDLGWVSNDGHRLRMDRAEARAQRSSSRFPLGLPSPPPFPRPLFPLFPEDEAMAVEFSDVDRSSVIAGGVTIANLPQVARNLRRSSSAVLEIGRFLWSAN
jgi:hypothetical protein